jgi:hypothetical protein
MLELKVGDRNADGPVLSGRGSVVRGSQSAMPAKG